MIIDNAVTTEFLQLLPIVFYVIGFLASLCTGKAELTFSCAKLIDGDYIKENIVYIIAAFFDTIFLALYTLLYFVSGFHIFIEVARTFPYRNSVVSGYLYMEQISFKCQSW